MGDKVTKILVINVPSWIFSAWRLVCAYLPKAVQEKITLVNEANTLKELRQYIDEDQIPKEYGSQGKENLYQSSFERQIKNHVMLINSMLEDYDENDNNRK